MVVEGLLGGRTLTLLKDYSGGLISKGLKFSGCCSLIPKPKDSRSFLIEETFLEPLASSGLLNTDPAKAEVFRTSYLLTWTLL